MSDVIIGCESREPYIPGMERTGTGVSSLHFCFLRWGVDTDDFLGGLFPTLLYIYHSLCRQKVCKYTKIVSSSVPNL